MKSAKFVYLCSVLSGLTLFFVGVFMIINLKTTPPLKEPISDIAQSSDSSGIVNNYSTTGDPINILVLVKEASGQNTDSISAVNYDPNTRQVSVLTIPRDTIPSNNATIKINSLFDARFNRLGKSGLSLSDQKHKAVEYTAQAVSNLVNITIDYYVYLEIGTIKHIIDELGGVYFDVPADLKYSDPAQNLYINLKKGYQLLDGNKAEQLLRFRKPRNMSKASADLRKFYDGSDLKRTEIQIKFVNEFIKQKVTILNLPKFIPLINYTFENVITNISLSDTINLFGGFTQSSRPEMNTFKLYGVDKRLNNLDYFVFIDRIEDTKSRNIYASNDIVEKYFTSAAGLFTPSSKQKYDYKSILNTNPSNAETDLSGDGKDKP